MQAGVDVGGQGPRVTVACPTETAKLNAVDPQARLTDVLTDIADHKTFVSTNSSLGGYA
jgi:hypothetical protein